MAFLRCLNDNIIMKNRLKKAYAYNPNFDYWPKEFVEKTKEAGLILSVPHLGIIMSAVVNLEFFMAYSEVHLEDSDWKEPLISWIMMHMASGTRKTAIYSFLENTLYEKTMEIIKATYQLSKEESDFLLHETTFEKLGMLLQESEGKKLWIHDEARLFLRNLVSFIFYLHSCL